MNRGRSFRTLSPRVAIIILAIGVLARPLFAADGPAPNYTKISGYYADAHLPTTQPVVLWKYSSAEFLTDVVVADGKVYGADCKGTLFALDARDGSVVWSQKNAVQIEAAPSLDRDQLYFGSNTGVTAVRRDSGIIVWHQDIDHGAGGSTPIPVGDRVIASGYDGYVYAFDRATGNILWHNDFLGDAPHDPPNFPAARARARDGLARPNGSASDGEIFIQSVFDQSRVVAFDCSTGKRRWSFQTGGWVSPAPTIVGDLVYVVSQDRYAYCLERATGKLLWKFQAPSWLASRIAVQDDRALLACHGPQLFELEADTGKKIAEIDLTKESDENSVDAVYSFPIIAGHTAYFAAGEGQVFAVDLSTGKLSWKFRPAPDSELFTSPATDGERIFVTSRKQNENDAEGKDSIIAIGLAK